MAYKHTFLHPRVAQNFPFFTLPSPFRFFSHLEVSRVFFFSYFKVAPMSAVRERECRDRLFVSLRGGSRVEEHAWKGRLCAGRPHRPWSPIRFCHNRAAPHSCALLTSHEPRKYQKNLRFVSNKHGMFNLLGIWRPSQQTLNAMNLYWGQEVFEFVFQTFS